MYEIYPLFKKSLINTLISLIFILLSIFLSLKTKNVLLAILPLLLWRGGYYLYYQWVGRNDPAYRKPGQNIFRMSKPFYVILGIGCLFIILFAIFQLVGYW